MAGELIGGGREPGGPGVLLILGGVDVPLPLLDADAHGEGLGLHGHGPGEEHGEGIPGGVARGQDEVAAGQDLRPLGTLHRHGGDGAVLDPDVRQLVLEADVRPQGDELPPQVPQGDVEVVRPHVGLGVHQDVPGGTAGGQFLQDKAVTNVPGAGIELPVREGSGPALPELDVGAGVQAPGAEELLHILLPLLHRAAPLQQDGLLPGPGQDQRGKEPRGARSHHDGADGGRRHGGGRGVGLRRGPAAHPLVPAAAEHRRLALYLRRRGADPLDTLPGVDAAAQQREGQEVSGIAQPQELPDPLRERILAASHRQLDPFDLQQKPSLAFQEKLK